MTYPLTSLAVVLALLVFLVLGLARRRGARQMECAGAAVVGPSRIRQALPRPDEHAGTAGAVPAGGVPRRAGPGGYHHRRPSALVWSLGRIVYARAYFADPAKRSLGFALTAFPTLGPDPRRRLWRRPRADRLMPVPDPVGPGQESVWDYPRPPRLEREAAPLAHRPPRHHRGGDRRGPAHARNQPPADLLFPARQHHRPACCSPRRSAAASANGRAARSIGMSSSATNGWPASAGATPSRRRPLPR